MDVEKIFLDANFSDETNFLEVLRMRLIKENFLNEVEEDELDDSEVEEVIAASASAYLGNIHKPSV